MSLSQNGYVPTRERATSAPSYSLPPHCSGAVSRQTGRLPKEHREAPDLLCAPRAPGRDPGSSPSGLSGGLTHARRETLFTSCNGHFGNPPPGKVRLPSTYTTQQVRAPPTSAPPSPPFSLLPFPSSLRVTRIPLSPSNHPPPETLPRPPGRSLALLRNHSRTDANPTLIQKF